jgi:hypothetical protein
MTAAATTTTTTTTRTAVEAAMITRYLCPAARGKNQQRRVWARLGLDRTRRAGLRTRTVCPAPVWAQSRRMGINRRIRAETVKVRKQDELRFLRRMQARTRASLRALPVRPKKQA